MRLEYPDWHLGAQRKHLKNWHPRSDSEPSQLSTDAKPVWDHARTTSCSSMIGIVDLNLITG